MKVVASLVECWHLIGGIFDCCDSDGYTNKLVVSCIVVSSCWQAF